MAYIKFLNQWHQKDKLKSHFVLKKMVHLLALLMGFDTRVLFMGDSVLDLFICDAILRIDACTMIDNKFLVKLIASSCPCHCAALSNDRII